MSGGPLGTLIILVFTGFSYTLGQVGLRAKVVVFLKSVAGLLLIFGLFAGINERFTKPLLKRRRPSHEYMLQQGGVANQIDSLYKLTKRQRGQYFDTLTKSNIEKFKQIDPKILAHWINESGFSFPSGHAFNAWLLAMVLAYAIYYNRHKPGWNKLYVLPVIWATAVALSRVAIGVHTPLDVSTGAALGIAIGSLLLYIDITRHWLTHHN